MLDISDRHNALIVGGIPLVTGANLLEQYQYIGLGFALQIVCDVPGQDSPTQTDLGTRSHLYIIAE